METDAISPAYKLRRSMNNSKQECTLLIHILLGKQSLHRQGTSFSQPITAPLPSKVHKGRRLHKGKEIFIFQSEKKQKLIRVLLSHQSHTMTILIVLKINTFRQYSMYFIKKMEFSLCRALHLQLYVIKPIIIMKQLENT